MINKLSNEYKTKFIDFSAGNSEFADLADIQQEGSVALYNILNQETDSIAYLADEVGMGKTFIALGTVMLMRYLNPTLRVLYIAPNKQLKNQWIEEYRQFIKNHINLSHGHVKSLSGESAVEYADCNSLDDLIQKTSSGYFADYFVQMNSFSFAMSHNNENDDKAYEKQLKNLKKYIPAYTDSILSNDKTIEDNNEIKQHYALALNYLLPSFDLIVVDEAHKFKNGLRSSTRNQMLALILGTSSKGIGNMSLSEEQRKIHKKLTSKTLLLSATPFDRNLEHIRNQIELFSGIDLAQKYFPKIDDKIKFSIQDKQELKQVLKMFLVRRLNKVIIGEDHATRNMYREEHRDNPIELQGFENKLVMALVQKHIGDLIEDRQTSSPSFQMGLLASFESFADSAGAKVFDGDDKITEGKDQAKDASLIQKLNDSYKEANLGYTMPHPKMDEVVKNHSGEIFANGEKHLFFVRRVKSVSELVNKWNSKYNEWIIKYLNTYSSFKWNDLYKEYKDATTSKIGIETKQLTDLEEAKRKDDEDSDIEQDEIKTDTFFSWFYKGKYLGEASSQVIPDKDFKIRMTKKDDDFSLYFELNWALYLSKKYNIDIDVKSNVFKTAYTIYSKVNVIKNKLKTNYFNRYHAAQFAALKYIDNAEARCILKIMYSNIDIIDIDIDIIDERIVQNDLNIKSIFNELNIIDENKHLQTFILKELLLTQFRQDHLMIDLYLSILNDETTKNGFIDIFIKRYKEQKEIKSDLTTYSIINNVIKNILLICETSLQKYTREVEGLVYKGLINSYNRNKHRINLSPLDPIIGVSGDTGNKSEPARKFRLPGYPIVMIATDVMQEGVNLHTFCRSITHYGLSGTPIHIEQKNGRVDRINSLTHRKIQSKEYSSLDAFHDEKIQVRFPFVKQSYESFQVRKLSKNLNDYLASLHDIEVDTEINDKLYLDQEFSNSLPIPKAYIKYLETPFEVEDNQKEIPPKLFEVINYNINEKNKLINLLSRHLGNIFEGLGNIHNQLLNGEKILIPYKNDFFIRLKPAKSNGEFLLEFTEESKGQINKIELLVGSETYLNNEEELTHEEEVLGAVERLFINIDLSTRKELDIREIEDIQKYWRQEKHIPFSRSEYTTFQFENSSIIFSLGRNRKHTINLYSINLDNREYILFHTKVCQNSYTKSSIVREVDMVKFLYEDGYIIGYTLHDLKNLQPKEFMYNAYILAVEADIFEYQLSIEDQF